MDSKVAPRFKIGNKYLNINHAYKMFKVMMMLITMEWNCDGTSPSPQLNVINGKNLHMESRVF